MAACLRGTCGVSNSGPSSAAIPAAAVLLLFLLNRPYRKFDNEKYMDMWKAAGIKVIPVVASVALAKRMEKYGADAVVAEGMESGGHIGEQTTMTLVPQVVDAVSIPVIAAGGIADGRGIAIYAGCGGSSDWNPVCGFQRIHCA